LLFGDLKDGGVVTVDIDNNEIVLNTVANLVEVEESAEEL
jgi:hypothetical protein